MKTMHQLNIDSVFSEIVVKDICKMIKKYNIKKIILPYEAQPFQKHLISVLWLTLSSHYREQWRTNKQIQEDFI